MLNMFVLSHCLWNDRKFSILFRQTIIGLSKEHKNYILKPEKMCDLIELCSIEVEIGVEVDPDCLIEVRNEILTEKL